MYTQGEWVFKTDKLTPLQVKACVCQQCPFPGELETKCDWCDNPKMMEFLRVAISAMEDFYTQENKIDGNALPSAAYDEYFTPSQGEGGLLSDEEICKTACGEYAGKCPARKLNHGCSDFVDIMAVITKQHALDQQHEANALKEQMERVLGKIDRQIDYAKFSALNFKQNDTGKACTNAILGTLDNLKAELEGNND